MRICLLASGSRGNAVYVESGAARLLIDSGLSARAIVERLKAIGVDPEDLDAILVTHEHRDHCQGLGPMARRYALPVYIHPETLSALDKVGKLPEIREFDTTTRIDFKDVSVTPFPLTHDAAPTVGFTIDSAEGKVGFATDLGMVTRLVRQRLTDSRVLILESNHDEEMLLNGPYPWPLKQRVRSTHGHLSNHDAAQLLNDLIWQGLQGVFLAHLSETNNQPELAFRSAQQVLGQQNICEPLLHVGCQDTVSVCMEL
ncbi:MAG: MBL fold metallo-hydrolase [Desulfuromonas sp.]|nr:MAG: MBL fold metallo-hydrolase [Desulfuromonas sp.]